MRLLKYFLSGLTRTRTRWTRRARPIPVTQGGGGSGVEMTPRGSCSERRRRTEDSSWTDHRDKNIYLPTKHQNLQFTVFFGNGAFTYLGIFFKFVMAGRYFHWVMLNVPIVGPGSPMVSMVSHPHLSLGDAGDQPSPAQPSQANQIFSLG